MTGEITLRGKVQTIGGLKEKLLAAKRSIITTVMIPHNNKKHLSEVPDEILNGLEIIPVTSIEEVLEVALSELPSPVTESETEDSQIIETKGPEVSILPQKEVPEAARTYDA